MIIFRGNHFFLLVFVPDASFPRGSGGRVGRTVLRSQAAAKTVNYMVHGICYCLNFFFVFLCFFKTSPPPFFSSFFLLFSPRTVLDDVCVQKRKEKNSGTYRYVVLRVKIDTTRARIAEPRPGQTDA